MPVNRMNNVSFQGVLVNNCSKQEAIDKLTELKVQRPKDLIFTEKDDSVELSMPKDSIKKELAQSPTLMNILNDKNDFAKAVNLVIASGESGLYSMFKSLGYDCKLTGKTAQLISSDHLNIIC